MRKTRFSIFIATLAILVLNLPSAAQTYLMGMNADGGNREETLEWFQDSHFGLFIHWGLYSQAAGDWKGKPAKGGEHFMLYEKIPLKEYATLANDFNPTGFNAEEWVKAAKEGGMKYIVYTTKHHEGFAMYDSQSSDYNIVKKTPFKRDPLKELADACAKEDIKLGLYYSLGRDWEDPDVPTPWPTKGGRSNLVDYPDEDSKNLQAYVDRKVKPQLRELLTNYGDIAMIWFDTPELITRAQAEDIQELINGLQPSCLINSRIAHSERVGRMGDYNIVEQQLIDSISTYPWESCLTMSSNWGYNKHDKGYRSPEIFIRHLADITSKGGNLLLNIGPTDKGAFPDQTKPILEGLHKWLAINGEAIYETRPWHTYGETLNSSTPAEAVNKEFHDAIYDGTPKERTPDFRFTKQKYNMYIIARDVKDLQYTLKSFTPADKVRGVTLLENGKAVKYQQTKDGLSIDMTGVGATQSPIYVLKVAL